VQEWGFHASFLSCGRTELSENTRRETMTMPGFSAETSLYGMGIQYGGMRAAVQPSGVIPQQLAHLFAVPPIARARKRHA
jgi:hypothetical protein